MKLNRMTLALLLLGWALCRPSPSVRGQDTPPADALTALNNDFRAEYTAAKKEALAQEGPVILSEGDKLVFLRRGAREEAVVKPPIYHELKAVSHIPLALEVMLAAEPNPLSETRLARLAHYRDLLSAAQGSLTSEGFSPQQVARQKQIVEASRSLLDKVIAAKSVDETELHKFTRGMAPLLWANVNEAAGAEMQRLYAQMPKWCREMSPEEWRTFHVVIIGPHMPREQEVSYQYFARLLGQRREGERVIYAESLWQERDALDLLATHIVDEQAGAAFFDDPMRMHRDLLGDAAEAYLDAHPVNLQ
jgi:hypothetical protein